MPNRDRKEVKHLIGSILKANQKLRVAPSAFCDFDRETYFTQQTTLVFDARQIKHEAKSIQSLLDTITINSIQECYDMIDNLKP